MNELTPQQDMDKYYQAGERALKYAKSKNIKFELQGGDPFDIDEQIPKDMGHKYCSLPWYRMSLQQNGDVYPCPTAYHPVGNFFEEDILDIWKGEKLKI